MTGGVLSFPIVYNINMKITILTLFPEMIRPYFEDSILKRAQEKGQVEIEIVNFRDFATDNHKTVDQTSYGGGIGMVLMIEPLVAALRSVTGVEQPKGDSKRRILLTSARGPHYTQQKAEELKQLDHIVLIAGHYEGFDERIHDFVDEEVSLGDFVMTGGEICAVAVADSIIRLLPGVLKHEEATAEESFGEVTLDELSKAVGNDPQLQKLLDAGVESVRLLEYPHYTRPEVFEGAAVPEILLSGHHAEIRKWRLRKAYEITLSRRPDMLDKA